MLYLEYYLRPRGSRVSNHLEIRRSVVGGERKELLFLSDLFILVRNAACVNFYGNAAWFTTQYLEEISRRRKIEGGMITFPPFSFYFYAPSTPWITTRLLLFPDYIFFFPHLGNKRSNFNEICSSSNLPEGIILNPNRIGSS